MNWGTAVRPDTAPGTVNCHSTPIHAHMNITFFSGSEVGCFSEGSSAIDVKTSNLETIVSERSKFSDSEVPIGGCVFRNHTHSWLVELDCVSSDLPIALNACYGVPRHSDVSGAHQQSMHILWSSRWSCRKKAITTYPHT